MSNFFKGMRCCLLFCCLVPAALRSQETFPVNGITDPRSKSFAFTHASIFRDGQSVLTDATLLTRDGRIVACAKNVTIPADVVITDCSGKFIYPSFIDLYTDYGMPAQKPRERPNFRVQQIETNTKGAYGWNRAIRPETNAYALFETDDSRAESLRNLGFGTVLTHRKDGIARGTGSLVTLSNKKENLVLLKAQASAHYSFNKGSSQQGYPTSLMGAIALLRQTYYDAAWYKSKPAGEGTNLSLQAWNDNQALPQIFEANDKWNDLRAMRIASEFSIHYIIKAGGNEYQRIGEIAASKQAFILPVNFPAPIKLDDPDMTEAVSLAEMKHWEMAPGNPAAFEKANIPFCISTADLTDLKQFATNLKKSIDYGLSPARARDALTAEPAKMIGVYDLVGSLDPGKLANFLITDGALFADSSTLLENWIQGEQFIINKTTERANTGKYLLHLQSGAGQPQNFSMQIDKNKASLLSDKDTLAINYSLEGKLVTISSPGNKSFPRFRLSGAAGDGKWIGSGEDSAGQSLRWSGEKTGSLAATNKKKIVPPDSSTGKIYYPFDGYGWESLPKANTLLIRNATVWTNETEGILTNTDVLVKNGKIAAVGKNLSDAAATIIDGTGKHLTPGIVDEHSHIAVISINEASHSVTSEVRMADVLNPEDIDIYRQLSGGVTTSHILHGSANTIGGQTALIKHRWGLGDDGLKFGGNDPFIKFALGENVKQTRNPGNNRYPDTRMGVPEVVADAFQRAQDYDRASQAAKGKNALPVRRDLELDALVDIMHRKMFITCHSYVTSEILALMRTADRFGFRVNTFTHILEGYKLAPEIKAHGASVSTFSDWWTYKLEVQDAIAYNAAILQKAGLNVCINSDDAEMGRRLNQEAAKTVKYGGVSEEDAFKMVTLNPAKALHIDNRVGSIKAGKDADLVLWTDHPLSVYGKADKTIVDGIVYYDMTQDTALRERIRKEKARLIQKMAAAK